MRWMDILCVTVDCHDPASLATFWNEALGWRGIEVATDGAIATCSPADGGIYLEFVRVPEAKAIKNRLHLGCTSRRVDDLDTEVERLLGLGAVVAWEEHFSADVAAVFRNLVLRDPEGNEFCLGGGTPPKLKRYRRSR